VKVKCILYYRITYENIKTKNNLLIYLEGCTQSWDAREFPGNSPGIPETQNSQGIWGILLKSFEILIKWPLFKLYSIKNNLIS